MAITPRSMSGRIRGRTIELDTESGLPDGQTVTVTVEPALRQAATETTLEALRRKGKRGRVSFCEKTPDPFLTRSTSSRSERFALQTKQSLLRI